MQLRLDPWAAEYNTAYYAEDINEQPQQKVDPYIEQSDWQAVVPPEDSPFDTDELLFVDGSRRIEARVLLETGLEQIAFGAIGTYAIGVVSCCPQHSRQAQYLDVEKEVALKSIKRLCTLSNGREIKRFDIYKETKHQLGKLEYEVESTDERDPDAVLRKLQNQMLQAERDLVSAFIDARPKALIIKDGPHPRIAGLENVVGYVKTIHDLRIGREQLEVIRLLEQGQRSPLFLVREGAGAKSHSYFECFLRLRDPRPWLYSLAGMVRLQIHAGSKPEQHLARAISLANFLSSKLPKFSSRQYQDPRAPQQLLPIRALEGELKRRMGHPQVIRRRIMQYLSEQQRDSDQQQKEQSKG